MLAIEIYGWSCTRRLKAPILTLASSAALCWTAVLLCSHSLSTCKTPLTQDAGLRIRPPKHSSQVLPWPSGLHSSLHRCIGGETTLFLYWLGSQGHSDHRRTRGLHCAARSSSTEQHTMKALDKHCRLSAKSWAPTPARGLLQETCREYEKWCDSPATQAESDQEPVLSRHRVMMALY